MGKPHAQCKTEINFCTLDLVAEKGVKKVTTRVISDRVGNAQDLMFRYFKSHDSIFVEAIERLASQQFETLSACIKLSDPGDRFNPEYNHGWVYF